MKKRFALKSVRFNDPGDEQEQEAPADAVTPSPEAGAAAEVPAEETAAAAE